MNWELEFNKIYYIKNNRKELIIDDDNVKLDPSNYLIYAPKIYFESILDNFFKKYIDDDICYLNYFNEYISIICDKSDKFTIEEIRTFPSIYLDHIKLNYTFELSYKDLFVEKYNIYWFLVISDRLFYTTGWTFGNFFMRKYQLIFNIESKEIGFYNPKLSKYKTKIDEKNKKNENSQNTFLYIILIISLCIILFGISIFIKMKFYPKSTKKKRANELDDDYEYISDKKEDNSINNN